DVPSLVDLAPLHERILAEHASDGGAQTLAAVDDEEPRAIRLQPARRQILEHRRARDLVLRRALPEAENVLRARRVDPESAEDHVLAEVNAVDEDGPEIEVAERSLHPLDELL